MSQTKQTTGTLESVIAEAVQRGVEAAFVERINPVLASLQQATPAAAPTASEPGAVRYISMTELCTRLSINRTTALRRERLGKIPARRAFPDGRLGWNSTDIDAWFASAAEAQRDPVRNADLASRLTAKKH